MKVRNSYLLLISYSHYKATFGHVDASFD